MIIDYFKKLNSDLTGFNEYELLDKNCLLAISFRTCFNKILNLIKQNCVFKEIIDILFSTFCMIYYLIFRDQDTKIFDYAVIYSGFASQEFSISEYNALEPTIASFNELEQLYCLYNKQADVKNYFIDVIDLKDKNVELLVKIIAADQIFCISELLIDEVTNDKLLHFLIQNSERYVTLEYGKSYTNTDWTIKIDQFKNIWLKNGYLAQYPLRNHLDADNVCKRLDLVEILIQKNVKEFGKKKLRDLLKFKCNKPSFVEQWWIDSVEAYTPPHYDDFNNFYVCLYGTKYIVFFENEEALGDVEKSKYCKNSYNMSLESCKELINDIIDDNQEKNKRIDIALIILNAGDAIYIPKKVYHAVYTNVFSVAISHWWKNEETQS